MLRLTKQLKIIIFLVILYSIYISVKIPTLTENFTNNIRETIRPTVRNYRVKIDENMKNINAIKENFKMKIGL